MSTPATPGTRSRCWRIFQYEIDDSSMRSSSSDVMPIFMIRLVADSAGIIHGGLAQVGMFGDTCETRSCTSWRARVSSVPFSKMSRIDDSWATDFDRISASPGRPLSASSIGTVTSDSTSDVELPRAMVWISTCGGANSGKTSTFDSGILASENAMNVPARKMTIQRKWRLRETIQRMSVRSELELGAVDLRNPHGHHAGAVRRPAGEVDRVAVDLLDRRRLRDGTPDPSGLTKT